MIVAIGSRSLPKIIATTRAFSRYPELWVENSDKIEYVIMSKENRQDEKQGQEKDALSGVSCNPMTIAETINGAKNRAKSAFEYAKEKHRKVQLWCRNRSWYV